MNNASLVVTVFLASFLGGLLGHRLDSAMNSAPTTTSAVKVINNVPEIVQVDQTSTKVPVPTSKPTPKPHKHKPLIKKVKSHKVVLLVDTVKMLSFHNYHSRVWGTAHQLKSCQNDLKALKSRVSAHPELYPGENPHNYACVVVNSTN